MVKCLSHGLRSFNGAVQHRLPTLTVTMLISSCWQLSIEVELRRIFAHCKCKNAAVRQPPVLASCIEIYYLIMISLKSGREKIQGWTKIRKTLSFPNCTFYFKEPQYHLIQYTPMIHECMWKTNRFRNI